MKTSEFPKINHISSITASIIVGYALMPFVSVPARTISFLIFGFAININLSFYLLISLITGLIAAAGVDWIFQEHPTEYDQKRIVPHMILPALTAGAIGIPLGIIEISPSWWIILALGSFLVFLVLVGEYISIDENNSYFPIALMLLSAVSYGLLLIITISIRAANLRLYLTSGIIAVSFPFLTIRMLSFRLKGKIPVFWIFTIAIIVTQFTVAIYYWPISPIRYGLFILGLTYALVGTASSLYEKPDFRSIFYEPLITMVLIWLLAFILP